MACRGIYFALTKEESRKLLEANDDAGVIETVEEIEERWDENWLQQVDKAWDAIHRCLSDGTLQCKGKSIMEKTVLGGKQLYHGDDNIISYLDPKEVQEVSAAIENIAVDWFRKKYFGLKKSFLGIKYSNYDGLIDEEDFEYSWAYFIAIREFFTKTATAGRALVFTVDQ